MGNGRTKRRMILFVAACVIFGAVGSRIVGPYDWGEWGILEIFYQKVPVLLRLITGRPLVGMTGVIYTLAASAVLLVLSVSLYLARNDNGEWNLPSSILQLLLCFPYLSMIASVMIDLQLSWNFIDHWIRSMLAVVLFVIGTVYALLGPGSDSRLGWQRLAMWLAGVGLSLSISGFAGVIRILKKEYWFVWPSRAAQIFRNMERLADGSVGWAAASLVILLVLAIAVVLAWQGVAFDEQDRHTGGSILLGFLVVLYWCYNPLKGTDVYAQTVKYWLLLVVASWIIACMRRWAGKRFLPSLAACLIVAGGVQTFSFGLLYLYGPIDGFLGRILVWAQPGKRWAESVVGIFFGMEGIEGLGMYLVTAVVVGITVLLHLPLARQVDPLGSADWYENPRTGMLAAGFFTGGVMLRAFELLSVDMDAEMKVNWFRVAAYAAIMGGLVVLLAMLAVRLLRGVPIGWLLYQYFVLALVLPMYFLFAGTVGIVVTGIYLGCLVCKMLKELMEDPPDMTGYFRVMNYINYSDTIDALNVAVSHGADERQARNIAAMAADTAIQNDRALRAQQKANRRK